MTALRIENPRGGAQTGRFGAPDFRDLRDAALCFGLVGPTAPYQLAFWITAPVWAPLMASGMAMPHLGGVNPHRDFGSEGCDLARRLTTVFLALPEARKARIRIPMLRLNRAMRRDNLVDAAIDLGIALEALYLYDLHDDRGELTFRLRTRAARFLANNESDRKNVYRVVGDLYTCRSRAVHTGIVPPKLRRRPVKELLEEGFELTAATVRAYLLDGDPDWDKVMFH